MVREKHVTGPSKMIWILDRLSVPASNTEGQQPRLRDRRSGGHGVAWDCWKCPFSKADHPQIVFSRVQSCSIAPKRPTPGATSVT